MSILPLKLCEFVLMSLTADKLLLVTEKATRSSQAFLYIRVLKEGDFRLGVMNLKAMFVEEVMVQ